MRHAKNVDASLKKTLSGLMDRLRGRFEIVTSATTKGLSSKPETFHLNNKTSLKVCAFGKEGLGFGAHRARLEREYDLSALPSDHEGS